MPALAARPFLSSRFGLPPDWPALVKWSWALLGTTPGLTKESAKKLLALADEKDAMMIYGHDPDQWRTLHKAPSGFYS